MVNKIFLLTSIGLHQIMTLVMIKFSWPWLTTNIKLITPNLSYQGISSANSAKPFFDKELIFHRRRRRCVKSQKQRERERVREKAAKEGEWKIDSEIWWLNTSTQKSGTQQHSTQQKKLHINNKMMLNQDFYFRQHQLIAKKKKFCQEKAKSRPWKVGQI